MNIGDNMSNIDQINFIDRNLNNLYRYDFIDIARALLIILMVIGHSGSPITNTIYLFHMPAFIFLSGFVFKESDSNMMNKILKKIKSLYIPYIRYQFTFLLFTNIFVFIGIYGKDQLIDSLEIFIFSIIDILTLGGGGGLLLGPMWFIVLLIEINIIYIIIQKLVSLFFKNKNIYLNFLILTIFITGFHINYLGLQIPRYIDTSLICLGLYHLGVLYKRYYLKVPMNLAYFIITFIILLYLSDLGSINIGIDMYVNPLFFITSFISGTYVVIYISILIDNFSSDSSLFRRAILGIGRNTLMILALHLLSFKLVTFIIISLGSYSSIELQRFPIMESERKLWVLYSISGILIPMLIVNFTHRVHRIFE